MGGVSCPHPEVNHEPYMSSKPNEPWICIECRQTFKADPYDRFFTDPAMAKRVVEWARLQPGDSVLEPSAGDGGLVASVPPGCRLTMVELIQSQVAKLLVDQRFPKARIVHGDFLKWRAPEVFDVAIMNPPYSSEPGADGLHVSHALRCARRVVTLVRTNFAHGFQRYHQVFRWSRVTRQVVLSRRPPFSGPADSGHGARHDYQILELCRREREREPGDTDQVELEFWV